MTPRRIGIVAALLALLVTAAPVSAHGPDPVLGGSLWSQNQALAFSWDASAPPPGALQSAIVAAATDNNSSRLSRAATLAYGSTGIGRIAYGVSVTCATGAIACTYRSAPSSFLVTFQRHGYAYDWGILRWCQMYSQPWPDGCFDVERVALHEFGHVQILDHHVMYSDQRDYLDAVMESYTRSKPNSGWNAHAYGRCDVATLQRKYNVPTWSTKYSTCALLSTTLGLTSSASTIRTGQSVTFTAPLRVAIDATYEQLSGNPLASRQVSLQRRVPGSTSWTTVATGATDGNGIYTVTLSPTATYEWRTVFATPTDEGLAGSASGILKVTVTSCTSSPCPSLVRGR
jgi:hypothetical protein